MSRRHLAARFREGVGLSPKLIGRIMRFNRVVALLGQDKGACWSRMAHECGYHDQSDLNHDFRKFAGATPSEYLHRLLLEGGGVLADHRIPVGNIPTRHSAGPSATIAMRTSRAKTAGAAITQEPVTQDYRSCEYCCTDPEGHSWSFGTYRPGAAAG